MSSERPSLYGYDVETSTALHFLRRGGGAESLRIAIAHAPAERPMRQPLADWPLQGAATPARATLYRSDDGFEFWTTDTGRYVIDPGRGHIEMPAGVDPIVREQRLCGVPMILTYTARGDFSLHAAAVELPTGALLLAGPSRFGKSTLALAFHKLGYRLLSEDLVCCRPGTLSVLPGPALIRARPDVLQGGTPEGTELVLRRSDRVYLGIEENRRGTSAPVPLRGVVFLREAPDLRMERVSPQAVIPDLWALNFRLPTPDARTSSFRQITRIASAVPVWNLYRPLTLDSLQGAVELLAGSVVG